MISGFHRLTIAQRRQLFMCSDFDENDMLALAGAVCSETIQLDQMSENVVGALRLPMGILTGLTVNGIDRSTQPSGRAGDMDNLEPCPPVGGK